jgi:hypothetical protein
VFFGLSARVGDHRTALVWVGCLFVPAAAALLLPEPPDEQ